MIRRVFNFIKSNQRTFLFGASSGILIATSWIPFPPWSLLFCWVPLWYFALESKSLKHVFWASWLTQFFLSAIGFHWIAYVAHEFGYLPWSVSILVLVFYCALGNLHIPIALILGKLLQEKLKLQALSALICFAALQSLAEQFWPGIFPWNMGYPLIYTDSIFAQFADTVGFLGLSLFVLLMNAVVLTLFISKNFKYSLASMGAILIFGAALYYFGSQKKLYWQSTNDQISILAVQGNIGNLAKVYAEQGRGYQTYISEKYFSLTKIAVEKEGPFDLIIWPESSYPEFLNPHESHRTLNQSFIQFVKSIQTPILTGAYSKSPNTEKKREEYNGIFLYDHLGNMIGEPYHKMQLLIFGEYIPFQDWFPWLEKYNPAGSGWSGGNKIQIFPIKNISIGPQICYESLDPHFSSTLAAEGSSLIVNLTNDSWFGPYFEPQQHYFMTAARALETRRPLIRVTNTGFTGGVLASGDFLEKGPLNTEWTKGFKIPYLKDSPLTIYTRFGKWLVPAITCLLILMAIFINGGKNDSSERP